MNGNRDISQINATKYNALNKWVYTLLQLYQKTARNNAVIIYYLFNSCSYWNRQPFNFFKMRGGVVHVLVCEVLEDQYILL